MRGVPKELGWESGNRKWEEPQNEWNPEGLAQRSP